jgi:hypothetical protein
MELVNLDLWAWALGRLTLKKKLIIKIQCFQFAMTLDFQVFFALLQNVNTAKNVLVTNAIVTNCGLVSYMHNSSSQEPFAVFFQCSSSPPNLVLAASG